MKNDNYIGHTSYLKNSITYNHDFWCTCVRWCMSRCFFPFFLKFLFFGLLRGWKVKNLPKIKYNSYNRHAPYPKNSIAYDHEFWYTCVKWWYLQVFFFFFFYIFIFWAVRGVKGQKWPKMTKKICLLQLISQEPYIIWLWFMVHLCKIMMALAFFFLLSFFQNFNSLGC